MWIAAVRQFARREDVLGNRHVAEQIELLEHHADAAGDSVGGGREGNFLALQQDAPMRRFFDAGDDLHQRRFAGAVLADQHIDRAAPHLEIGALDRYRPEIDFR